MPDRMGGFGAMAFASRLKRLSDRLKSEATKIYRANGVEFNDSWFLLALMLSHQENASVTETAEAFGVSHAAVSQMAAAMARQGLLVARTDERDRRRSLLCLTPKGREAVETLRPIWIAVGQCTEHMIASTGKDVLAAISEIEKQLERRSLFTRVTERMNKSDR